MTGREVKGAAKVGAKAKAEAPTGWEWRLSDDGMLEMERAALAGMYLTFSSVAVWAAAEWDTEVRRQARELRDGEKCDGEVREILRCRWGNDSELVDWRAPREEVAALGELTRLRVEWAAPEKAGAALDALIRWAWQVRDGVLFLPGVHRRQAELDNYYLRLPMHSGILGTFLQHGKCFVLPAGIQSKAKEWKKKSESVDENVSKSLGYFSVSRDVELPQWKRMGKLLSGKGAVKALTAKQKEAPAWLYPGAAARFGATEANWQARDAKHVFLMLFAPIANYYLQLPGGDWAFIVPNVLELGVARRQILSRRVHDANWRFESSFAGMEDSVLHYLADGALPRAASGELKLTAMGEVKFYSNQRVRKGTLAVVRGDVSETVRRYKAFCRAYPLGSYSRPESVAVKAQIAANIFAGRRWYEGLTDIMGALLARVKEKGASGGKMTGVERLNGVRRNEGRKLMTIEKDCPELWDKPWEQALVRDVFRRAYRNLLGEVEAAAGRQGHNVGDRWGKRQAELFRHFNQCKTQSMCREVVIALLARAKSCGDGLIHNPQDEHNAVGHLWRMLNDPRECRKAVDLATFALITFTDGRLGASGDKKEEVK